MLKAAVLLAVGFIAFAAQAVNLTPLPPYLSETKGSPMVMLNLSRDHQLFYKAYNEYSDLDGDGLPETQYKHSYRYYGYFDSQRCYTYNTSTNRFVPARKENASSVADPTYCGGTGEWHGNFMNWATTTRMDVVRRILYGGYRSTDDSIVPGPPLTVLERAHLPTDAHAFAKYFKEETTGQISKLTPFNKTEITICNASFKNGSVQYSHGAISAPSILVADGNYALWNSNERWQCYWSEDKAATNGNVPANSGLNASANNPSRVTKGLGTGYATGSYTARVEVCKTGLDGAMAPATGFTDDEQARCKLYPLGNYKPVGLLQKYGEANQAAFGLMTGSFNKNLSGGVLRKNVASFTDEVDLDDGQFKSGVNGIVKNLNALRIYGYDYSGGTYNDSSVDNCSWQVNAFTEGTCGSWGNPMGEIYLESLRYLVGKKGSAQITATPAFDTSGGKDQAIGLTVAAWSDPFAASTVASFGDQLCRRTSVVNFNASVTSYDGDQWALQTDIYGFGGTVTAATLTDQIGNSEGLYAAGKKWSIGSTATDTSKICTDKAFTSLAGVGGVCPEAPTQSGSYLMAGAALYAHTNPIRNDFTIPASNKRAFRVDTYGVALATGTPRIQVAVPSQPGKFVVIQPAYRSNYSGAPGAGTLVDFRVVSQTSTHGKYLIQWEDSERGGDYDQDMWGTLEYTVTGNNIAVSTTTYYQSTVNPQGFGYVISGTSGKDGAHFHSGILNYSYTDPTNITVTPTTHLNASGGCNNCTYTDVTTTATYAMTGVSADVLHDPLWYAAKYGGFDRDKYTGVSPIPAAYVPGTALIAESWDAKKTDGTIIAGGDGIPDTFFYAIDPAQLEKSLEQIFQTILKSGGAAPAAATSSRTAAGGYVYVSTHSIKGAGTGVDADASGQFLRYSFQSNGNVSGTPDWDAGVQLTAQASGSGWNTGRNILTLSDTAAVAFRWANLSTTQQTALQKNPATGANDSVAVGQSRLNWLRGSACDEVAAGTTTTSTDCATTPRGGLRARAATKLGAIINSTPWFVGAPAAGYTNVDYSGGYGTFRSANLGRNAVFVAANDGMLHAFHGGTGSELFAYVPRALYTTSGTAPYTKLAAITAKNFSLQTTTDGINADGSVMAADMKTGSPATWKTYLFGSFGRGAKGIYALDVSSPTTVTESSATTVVKWEFTDAADSDMGYIVGRTNSRSNGQPTQTGMMANGKWAAIYGNGYNSASGNAALFIIFADGPASASATTWTNGTHYQKILVGTAGLGPNNGLAAPTAVDTNNDGVIDVIYAGDLKGNVWKFNVSDANPANWRVATTGSVPSFQATNVVTNAGPPVTTTTYAQPITTTIVPFAHPQGGYQLFFGTGKVLESTDYPMTTPYSQTLYGIYDQPGINTTLTTGKTDLVQQTTIMSGGNRYFSKNTVNYPTQKGWYLDLPVSSENVIFNPIAEDAYRVNVRSLAPESTSDGCRYDATSYDITINPINGTPISDLIPGAALVTGYGAVGGSTLNAFEYSRGGVFKAPTPPPSTTTCTAGAPDCVCNPAAGHTNECVLCPDPLTCNPPWKPLPQNQCMYRTLTALGNGGIQTGQRFGACTDGRLTWREILRNR